MSYKAIDIVVNVFTPAEFDAGQIATDDWFRSKTRQDPRYVRGIEIEDYLEKMDRAGIERSLLAAVRSGDMRIKGSVEIPYERVYELCQRYPGRFSGLAGVDPTRGMQGLRDLEAAVRDYGFVGAHFYPHWFSMRVDAPQIYPYYAKCCELDIPIMMQVGNCLSTSATGACPALRGRSISTRSPSTSPSSSSSAFISAIRGPTR